MSDKDAREEAAIPIRRFEIDICDACINLEGQECHTPGCRFFLFGMAEVGEYLNRLLIRPVIDGVRINEVLCEIAAAESQRTQAPSGPWMKDAPKDMATLQQTGNDRELKLREHNTKGMMGRHAGTQAPSEQFGKASDDLIARCNEAARRIFQDFHPSIHALDIPQASLIIQKEITRGTQAQAAQWISVKAESPKVGGTYLVVCKAAMPFDRSIEFGHFFRLETGDQWMDGQSREIEVTHWQPFPKKPLPVAPVAALEGKETKL